MTQYVRKPRRSPNFTRFIGSGVVLGFLAGYLVSVFGSASPQYDAGDGVGYLGLVGALLGGLLAGLLAVVIDMVMSRPRSTP